MQQRQQNLNWHRPRFFIQEGHIPYSGELYWIKINIALFVREGELDPNDEIKLEELIRIVAHSQSHRAKEMLQEMLTYALDCAIENNFHEVTEKINRYKELLHGSLIPMHNN